MITLIHGDDLVKSRKYLSVLKGTHQSAETLNGTEVNITSLLQILHGGSFFSEDKILFIEELLLKKKNTSEYKEIINLLVDDKLPAHIILWEGREIEKNILETFKNAGIKLFKLPRSLFSFLDALKPENGINLIKLFHNVLETTDEESVFYMLVRQFRLLLALHPESQHPSPFTLEDLKRLQSWQKEKLTKQSQLFNVSLLISKYRELYAIESGIKTGNRSSLINSVDIFLLGI